MAQSLMPNFRFLAVLAFLTLASSSIAAAESFENWLALFKEEAAASGIDRTVLDQALADLQPIDKVLELDRRQPEFSLSFADYMARVVSKSRVQNGRRLLARHGRALNRFAEREGVPAPVILAMWGIESDYGRVIGNFPVLPALATLAYDGRRSQYFRGELLKALVMVAEGVPPHHMRGSWAGAMGQCQFMPSTYLTYAKAAEGDGPADIWSKQEDVWSSTAHYLAGLSWQPGQKWGMAVKLPRHGMAPALFGLDHPRPLRDWTRLGLRRPDGKTLSGPPEQNLALIRVDGGRDGSGGSGPAFLVGDNFRALLHWNRSFFFAVAAGTLADRIASR
jgi:membrane-bound lytic murein transglycosylase B